MLLRLLEAHRHELSTTCLVSPLSTTLITSRLLCERDSLRLATGWVRPPLDLIAALPIASSASFFQ